MSVLETEKYQVHSLLSQSSAVGSARGSRTAGQRAQCENLAIILLGKAPKESEAYIRTKPRAWVFITALFKIIQNSELRCPSEGERINKV